MTVRVQVIVEAGARYGDGGVEEATRQVAREPTFEENVPLTA
jgi:hypothetical protein